MRTQIHTHLCMRGHGGTSIDWDIGRNTTRKMEDWEIIVDFRCKLDCFNYRRWRMRPSASWLVETFVDRWTPTKSLHSSHIALNSDAIFGWVFFFVVFCWSFFFLLLFCWGGCFVFCFLLLGWGWRCYFTNPRKVK